MENKKSVKVFHKTYFDKKKHKYYIIKNGNKFYKAIVSDDTGTITSLLFDGKKGMLEELKHDNAGAFPEENDIVAIKGRLKGQDAIFADKIIKQDCKIYRNMRDLK
jgi:hypothetical protein